MKLEVGVEVLAVNLISSLMNYSRTHGNHSRRVNAIARRWAIRMQLSEAECDALVGGALLHDIGKLKVAKEILHAPRKLTENEVPQMQDHVRLGVQIIQDSNIVLDQRIIEAVYYHHERWDGAGYPSGLRGERIPFIARAIGIVDVWDTILTKREYQNGRGVHVAIREIEENAGRQFDPELSRHFLNFILGKNNPCCEM